MATQYSTVVTNIRAVPTVNNPTTSTEGSYYSSSVTHSVAAADGSGEVYVMLPVHSSWSIKAIRLYNDAITSMSSADLGLYTSAATPAVVDVDAYASAVTLASARTDVPIDLAFEARNITGVNNRVWQDAGLTADPNVWYYLAFTSNSDPSAQGDVTLIVEYTV
jgi:hypothetical protein